VLSETKTKEKIKKNSVIQWALKYPTKFLEQKNFSGDFVILPASLY
jgi:hypothetical protein